MTDPSFWQRFERDPRLPGNAELRAGHVDRELVLEALSAAYAEGRLDADEFEERSDTTHAARTLADLPPLLSDLIPTASTSKALVMPEQVQKQALEKYREHRQSALMAFLVPSLICWAIYLWPNGSYGFPWPIFVSIVTGANLLGTLMRRQDIIRSETRKIEKRAEKERAKELKRQASLQELEAGPQPPTEPEHGAAGEIAPETQTEDERP